MRSQKRTVCTLLLQVFLFLTISSAIAQSASIPAWMEHVKRAQITKKSYLESQQIFDPYSISTVRITMNPSDYTRLINDVNSDVYLQADMTYESPGIPLQTIEQVGIRIRGAASRGTAKKSFKIAFDAFGHDDREFYSLQKMNLNCDFQDPLLMRAKTCTDLFRLMGVEAARTGYTKLYINGQYRGLFDNYEEFDKSYLGERFGNKNGNLYKCDGASMQNGSGGYILTTNEDFPDLSDIHNFIKVLNNTPAASFKDKIGTELNVDEMLMFTACNVLLGAWDDYWNLAKNYYIYHDPYTDQFNYIPHDFDGSLGTDWYYGDITNGDIYAWSRNSGRPMIDKLLEVPEFRDRYTHYLMLLCKWPFSLEAMEPEIDRTAAMIRQTLTTDPYYGWKAEDFDKALNQSIGGSVKFGLKEYINLRRKSALEQLDPIGPYQKQMSRLPLLPTQSDEVSVSQLVIDQGTVLKVKLVYKSENSSGETDMYDNGSGRDAKAGDYIFTAQIPAMAKTGKVEYYIEATNDAGLTSRYPGYDEWAGYTIGYQQPQIFINEVLASNQTKLMDSRGEYNDWFELYNPGENPVNLLGMYVSDDLSDPRKWRLGNLSVPAQGFLLLWADEDTEQGASHVGFKLSGGGEEIGLYDTDEHQNLRIDEMRFDDQTTDISLGRTEDGATDWVYYTQPTPGRGNRDTTASREELLDITDFGGIVSEPNNNSPSNETIINSIDNNESTKYLTLQNDTWIQYHLDKLTLVTGYSIVSANDAPDRDPSNWEFQAYDETKASWVTLQTIVQEPKWESRFEAREFFFKNTNWYNTYRLKISSSFNASIIQLAELEIYGLLEKPTTVEKPLALEFVVYPNPAGNFLNVKSNSELKTILITDIYGRMAKRINLNGDFSQSLDVSDLKSGIYILQAESASGEMNTAKFVKK